MIKWTLLWLLLLACSACSLLSLPDKQIAKQLLREGDVNQAQVMLEALSPYDLPEVALLLGDIALEKGDTNAALAYYRGERHKKEHGTKRLMKLLHQRPDFIQAVDCHAIEGLAHEGSLAGAAFLSQGLCPDVDRKKWLVSAAKAGDSEAIFALAQYSSTSRQEAIDIAVQKSQDELHFLPKLARLYQRLDMPEALSMLLKESQSHDLPDEVLFQLASYQSPVNALKIYTQLLDRFSKASLSIIHLGLKHPKVLSDSAYQQALVVAKEYAPEKANLLNARNFTWGIRGVQDPELAMQALLPLDSYPEAKYLLGQIHRHGFLGQPKPKLALELLNMSAQQGYRSAFVALADIYKQGRIVCSDEKKAQYYQDKALALGKR